MRPYPIAATRERKEINVVDETEVGRLEHSGRGNRRGAMRRWSRSDTSGTGRSSAAMKVAGGRLDLREPGVQR
ncbi:hypothetical protein GUJ93_ZPchr0013g37531 [Zizania palustris]|uniref:Uncharacterized protein n=1 Tax=Zizania palustris TaxID=103762 RepID=A0A8J5WVW8_ZIZPA|nr:hypothetical protein GUJ93_ZPchr0013g37531 [Zizania palustris]